MALIYVVEDDKNISEIESFALKNAGHQIIECSCAKEFRKQLQERIPELVLLDIMLPDEDGLSILGKLRATPETKRIPVILVTAKTTEIDKVKGLDAGADDYLVKPFALAELQARVRALIRRYQGHSDNLLTDGDITLNLQTQQVLRQSQPVEVTPKEFALLTRLIMRSGQTVHRETLQQDIYSWQDDPGSNTLEVHIHNLRRKLGKDRIKTVRGVGYRLESQK